MTALLAKAAAMALVQHPVVNASSKDGKSFTYNSSINGGLFTPVLQDADKLDLYLLSEKWKELVEKAWAKQLQPHEYNSGTFLGMFTELLMVSDNVEARKEHKYSDHNKWFIGSN